MVEKHYEPTPRPFQRTLRHSLQARKPTSLTIRRDAVVPLVDQDVSVLRALERLIRAAEYQIESRGETDFLRLWLTRCARFFYGLRVASRSRCSILMQLGLICSCLALATAGCGFLSLVFKGEDQQTLQETEVCDGLSSGVAAEVPLLVELRTDKAGTTRYRDLSLGGTEVDPQWVPMPNQHADATCWVQAGNFTKMDFQPPLQRALTPDSVIYIVCAPADARDATEQGQLNALNSAFGPEFGSFHWNGRMYRYSAMHKLPCRPPHSSEPGRSKMRSLIDRKAN